jgi:uncharacterized membrane protein
MTTFTVWKFDDPDRAAQTFRTLDQARGDGLVEIVDHAVVSWPKGAVEPDIRHSHDSAWHGTGWGAFWGVLFGSLFLAPILGGALGAGIGALANADQGTGITHEELERIRTEVTEGTSALFLVTEHGDLDRLGERFQLHSTLIATNLTEAERDELLATFGFHQP